MTKKKTHKERWASLKEALLKLLKSNVIKFAVKKILRSGAAGGFKVWLVTYIVTELYEEIGEPIVKYILNRVGYLYHKQEGKVIIKRLNEAEENQDEAAYDNALDDLFN